MTTAQSNPGLLTRLDDGLARGEAAIATVMLLLMILVAAAQATLRNLTNLDFAWANVALAHLTWADSFLQKGTLWLAFLGASLATHSHKHIAIDVLPRLAPRKPRLVMRGLVNLGTGVICFYLARVFFASVLNNAKDIPLQFSVLGASGATVHICDAPLKLVTGAGLERPDVFCAVRAILSKFGAPMSTPEVALQLIVPVMLLLMAVRFVVGGFVSFAALGRPPRQKDGPDPSARAGAGSQAQPADAR